MTQLILPRRTHPMGGVDYGAPRRVLASTLDGSVRLFIVGGSRTRNAGIRGFGHHHHPTTLQLQAPESAYELGRTIAEGRITKAVFRSLADEIDSKFEYPGLAERLDPRKTLWLTPDGIVENLDAEH